MDTTEAPPKTTPELDNFTLLRDHILVREEVVEMTKRGIFIAPNAQKSHEEAHGWRAEVLKTNATYWDKYRELEMVMGFNLGDLVIVSSKYEAVKVRLDGEELHMVPARVIVGVVRRGNRP